jgi:acyl-coenzyme A thioesterase PaaI-like protein
MADTTMGLITIVYRGDTQQFKTVSLAAHFLRQLRTKVGWIHTIQAAVNLMMNDEVHQTRHLKGDKYLIMKGLILLEAEFKPLSA